MSEADHDATPAAGKRGEAAWKEATERVAERNAQARKVGKQRRQAHEQHRHRARQDAERQQMANLLAKQSRQSR